MRMKYLYLFLFILLFSKAEARNFDFSKTYVNESLAFRLDFNEEKKTCDLYGIYCCHNHFMEITECKYSVVGDTLILYVPSQRFTSSENRVKNGEKKFFEIGLLPCQWDTLGCLPPEYSIFINDSLFLRNSYEPYNEIWYESDLERDKIVVESNCSHVVFCKDEFYSEGEMSIILNSCQEYIGKLIIEGTSLRAMPAPSFWNYLYTMRYEKLIFKPIGKKRLQRFHRKYPMKGDDM